MPALQNITNLAIFIYAFSWWNWKDLNQLHFQFN